MYDVNVVMSLINIEIKILDSFERLSSYFGDDVNFSKELYFLNNVLLKKEDILISKLPASLETLNIILDDIYDKKSNFFDNECQRYYVMERIQSIFDDLIIALDDDVYSDDDYVFNDSPKIRKAIHDNLGVNFFELLLNFIYENNDLVDYLINIGFMNIYTSKKNSNYFCKNGFSFENLSSISDEIMMRKFDIDNDSYFLIKNDEIYLILEDLTTSMLEIIETNDSLSILSYFMMYFKFLIHILSDEQLVVFKTYFLNFVKPLNDFDFIKEFVSVLDFETNKRGVNYLNNNKVAIKVEDDNIDDFIGLIKLEGNIFSLFELLDFDNYDYDIIFSLQSLVNFEEDLIENIIINKNNESVYKNLIENDLYFFLPFDDKSLSMVASRLFNTLPYFNDLDVSPTQTVDCYNYIRKNHIIRSLKKYIDLLIDGNMLCDINYLKKIIYLNGFITYDFLSVNGNYRLFEDLSDETICELLDMNRMEYDFDKNEQLIRTSEKLIYDILESTDEKDVFFKLLELDDIKDNLSEEYLKKLDKDIIPFDFSYHYKFKKNR